MFLKYRAAHLIEILLKIAIWPTAIFKWQEVHYLLKVKCVKITF